MTDPRQHEFAAAALGFLRELLRVATRVTGDPALAEDLVQETYLQAWRSFDRFERGTNCRAWLYKILFRTIARHRRRRDGDTVPVPGDDEPTVDARLAVPPAAGDPLARRRVLAAFATLSEPLREVLLLADVQELRYREVAAALDIPIGTVMSRLNRARGRLRSLLAGIGGREGAEGARERARRRWETSS